MNQKSLNTHAEQYDRCFDRNRFAYLSELEALKRVVPKTGKSLEIGVGTGRFALPLDAYAGVDSSTSMLKIAGMRELDRVKDGFGEGSFVVISGGKG